MKTLIKSLALALTLGITTTAASFAGINPGTTAVTYKSAVYTTITGKLSIALDKQKGGAVDVSLKDAEGKVVYARHLGKNESQYRTHLNLSDLPDGVYQVEITNGVETTSHKVTIATKQPITPSRVIALN